MRAKESFADVYNAPTPIPYYRGYAATRLSIVEYGAALVDAALDADLADGPVIDLACGYGTLGALLRTPLGIEGIYASYLQGRELRVQAARGGRPRIIGVDSSAEALSAALGAGLIDEGLELDLNSPPATLPGYGEGSIAVCCAALGYVQPRHLAALLEAIRPRLAIVTCVTWLKGEFLRAFDGGGYRAIQLNRRPLFQRWATAGEEARMTPHLIDGAHRSDCFALSMKEPPLDRLRDRLAAVRASRAKSRWLAAGRAGGCELTERDP